MKKAEGKPLHAHIEKPDSFEAGFSEDKEPWLIKPENEITQITQDTGRGKVHYDEDTDEETIIQLKA
jgi:hypothetical protein